jgi:hypothetical protein
VNTQGEAWFRHTRNMEKTGTAFPCRDCYSGPVNAGRGPVASGSKVFKTQRGIVIVKEKEIQLSRSDGCPIADDCCSYPDQTDVRCYDN